MSRRRNLAAGAVLALVAATFVAAAPASAAARPASAAAIPAAADALDGTCASLRVYDNAGPVGYVVRSGSGYGFTGSAAGAPPFRPEATQLGRYELFGSDGKPAYQSVVAFILAGDAYGDRADFTVARA